ncbi:alpha/beta fold hydrolase [Thermodesulfobacteriota bacterium]
MATDRKNLTFQSTNGEFHYISWGGNGPLAHFAHATGLCASVYSKMIEVLLPHLEVTGLDFRGHGKTKALADPNRLKSWDIFYDDLEIFIKHLDHPIIAIGHSLGGTVSLKMAACQPELISALIVIEPGIMPPSWRPWVYLAQKSGLFRFVPFFTRAAKRKSEWSDSEEVWNSLKGKGPFRKWRDEFLSDYIREGMVKEKNETIRLACNPLWEGRYLAMAPYNIWKFVRRIKVPTLVLYGAQSTTFLPPVIKKFREEVPHAVIHKFKETGHFVPMERPVETADIILELFCTFPH